MKVALLAFVGLFLGAIAGAVVGIGVGLAWTKVFETSGFEGYSGMLVFFTFMPIGALLGRSAAPSRSASSARATARHRRDEDAQARRLRCLNNLLRHLMFISLRSNCRRV